jgi:hypothetical protein
MSRVLSIDIMRGFALMCMVLIHFMIYFGDSTAVSTWPHFILDHVLGDWGAACFLMMMSMSQVLSADKRTDDPLPLFKRALIRGGYIFMIGILMLALTWGPSEIWQWDILTLMGTMTVILFFCRFLPSWLILVVSLFIAVATLWLRAGIDFASIWGGPFVQVPIISQYFPGILVDPVSGFTRIWKLQDVLLGFLFTGEFPLVIIGSLFVCLGLGGAYASLFRAGSSVVGDFISPLSFYPDSFTMICFQLGMALIVFSGLYFFYDVRKKDPSRVSFLVRLYLRSSRFSLTFYFLHYLMIGWPLAILAQITGRNSISALMGAYPALITGLAGLAFLETLLLLWEKHESKYSLEWWLAATTSRLMRR